MRRTQNRSFAWGLALASLRYACVLCLSCTASIGGQDATGTYFGSITICTPGMGPTHLQSYDTNGDGKPDELVMTDGKSEVAIKITKEVLAGLIAAVMVDQATRFFTGGKCPTLVEDAAPASVEGAASSGTAYPVGRTPASVAVADFNADGLPDWAVANEDSNSVSVLLRNNDGTYRSAVDYSVGTRPISIAAGDFNHDGKIDLAVVDSGSPGTVKGNVAILLGNGNGTFRAPAYTGSFNYSLFSSGNSLAVGDFNKDGKLDLAVTSGGSPDTQTNNLSILLGNGNGTFKNPVSYSAGSLPLAVVVGDFNGDHKLDLGVSNYYSNNVSILLGNGNGTFQHALNYSVGPSPIDLLVEDLNRDGKLDLAVVNANGDSLSILLGNGNGTFKSPANYIVGAYPQAVTAIDANGDGAEDLVAANEDSGNATLVLGNGDGTFQASQSYFTGSQPTSVAVGDFNGDRKQDLVTAGEYTDAVSILKGKGDGTFQFLRNVSLKSSFGPASVAAGDVNADGEADLAVAGHSGNQVAILLGNGNGTFQSPGYYPTGPGPRCVAFGDFNGDGDVDLAVANSNDASSSAGSTSILLGNGHGSFSAAVKYTVGIHPRFLAVADFNGDGKLDLAVADQGAPSSGHASPGDVRILIGNGNGTFKSTAKFTVGVNPFSLLVGDFNKDGKLDLAVPTIAAGYAYRIAVLLGNGNGTFQPSAYYATDSGPQLAVMGDFNLDGKTDLAVAHCCGAVTSTVLLGEGDGTFQSDLRFDAGATLKSIAVGDFNGDGRPDLVLTNSSGVTVLMNRLPG